MTAPLDGTAGRAFLSLQRTFRQSLFRLETLQVYGGSGEEAGLRAFCAGAPQPPLDGDDRAYLDAVRAARARGARWQRVHVVREPLTEYMRFQLTWEYASNVAAGEEIGVVVDATAQRDVFDEARDFWLVDDNRLFVPRYAENGFWCGFDESDDDREIERARHDKRAALRLSEPWCWYIARRPELAALLPIDAEPT